MLTLPIGVQTIPDDILTRFLSPDHAVLKSILTLWNYRGDGTQADTDRLRAIMGEANHEHFNWDTAVSNARILLVLRRFKHPCGVEPPLGFRFPPEWFWCFSQIEKDEDIGIWTGDFTVPTDVQESLSVLPALEWLRVRQVNFFRHGHGAPRTMHRPPPKGVAFFRFQGGLGLAAC